MAAYARRDGDTFDVLDCIKRCHFLDHVGWTRVHSFNRTPWSQLLLKSSGSWRVMTIVMHEFRKVNAVPMTLKLITLSLRCACEYVVGQSAKFDPAPEIWLI